MKKRGGAKVPAPSGTVTFLFSDIEGSTQRWDHNRAAMQEALRVHDHVMRRALEANGGHVFKTVGDAFCVAFATPESATAAALDAQRALGATDFSAVDDLRVRMAINTGTADERDGDYFGPALNRVARLLVLGHGGQVLLSRMAAELVRENPPPGVTLTDLGEYVLKGLEEREHVFQLAAPDLQRDFPELSAPLEHPWLVPDAMHTRYFTGRDDVLARLRQQLRERHRAALSGLGGVGKTQTAIEYAMRYQADYPDGIFWVNAETMNGLTSGFVVIGKTLRLPAAELNDQEAAVKAVTEWLNRSDRWLLILDNVADRDQIHSFVPERDRGDVLITSRESVFPELGVPRAFELQDLDNQDAVHFLLTRTGHEDASSSERAAAAELAIALGNLPLALEQAAAYIAETNASFFAYLAAFRRRRVTLLEKAAGLIAHDTVTVTWAANFEAVEAASTAAVDVLRIAALLAPNAIPFEIFINGSQILGEAIAAALADPDELSMAEVLRPLARYSLVRTDVDSHTLSVHRMVQEIAWAAVPDAERQTYVKRAILALNAAFPEVHYTTWPQCERLVPHVAWIAGQLEEFALQPEAAGGVLNRAGQYLVERGRYAEAQALHERALAVTERSLGSEHPDVATSLNHLAVAHWYQDRCAEAQPLSERALAIRERALGPDHPAVASSMMSLAILHSFQGRYAEAASLYERSLAIKERALGPDHPSLARGLSNLANDYERQGRYAAALPLYERAVAIWERALGKEQPDLAGGLNNLGRAYVKAGRYAEAEALFERALSILERSLGSDHPDIRFSLNNLANLLVARGQYAEAEVLFARALAIEERSLGPNHRSVASLLTDLAGLYVHLGRFAEAESSFDRALSIAEHGTGPYHPSVADVLVGLASLRQKQGRDADAAAFYERALTIKERTFAVDHPELAEIRSNLQALRAATTGGAASQADA
ncbi:MAG: tetratricopeptide repeat protein [Candidatus Tumulicola sp.]